MEVTLLYFDGCPNWEVADGRLGSLADEFGFTLVHRPIESFEAAEEWQFPGSPTVLVNGRDVFATGEESVGLACRIYRTPDGVAGAPTTEQLRAALASTEAEEADPGP